MLCEKLPLLVLKTPCALGEKRLFNNRVLNQQDLSTFLLKSYTSFTSLIISLMVIFKTGSFWSWFSTLLMEYMAVE